jgi:hypothetical protein
MHSLLGTHTHTQAEKKSLLPPLPYNKLRVHTLHSIYIEKDASQQQQQRQQQELKAVMLYS